jgi:predicted dehydrogenase
MPDPILVGRSEKKLCQLCSASGLEKYSTNLDETLNDPSYQIYFDAQTTNRRVESVLKAIDAKKSIYCEKPTAESFQDSIYLYRKAEDAGVKHGVVQDKLFLPGPQKFLEIKKQGVLGEIFSVQGEFGYWVFTGHHPEKPPQRPSWNYRKEDGGGIILDMHCHWRYVIDHLISPVTSVLTTAKTNIKERIDENGKTYVCTADDDAYAIFKTEAGIICQFHSSWTTRVRRDDLFTMLIDGSKASALVGLRKCWIQTLDQTPRFVWNPDTEKPGNFYDRWQETLPEKKYENAFKTQWALFLRHVVLDEPFIWNLKEGAKGVELAEKSLESHEMRRWIDLEYF